MIIETSANELYRVREIADPAFAHCWMGVPVKRVVLKAAAHVAGTKDRFRISFDYVPKKNAREQLVRKLGSCVIAAEPITTATGSAQP